MSDPQGPDNNALNQGGAPEHAPVNNTAARSSDDKDQLLTVDQVFELFNKLLQKSEDRFRSIIQKSLPAQPSDPRLRHHQAQC
jgi:hypothetical protein